MIGLKAKVTCYSDYCVAYVDDNLAKYYRALLPKYYDISPQKYPAHVTIVRKSIERPQIDFSYYNNKIIQIYYVPCVKMDDLYYWLDVYSDDIGHIRESIGLSWYREPFDCYHISLGNKK